MNISISIQVRFDPDNTLQSPVLLTAAIPEKENAPVFAAGTLKNMERLVAQVIDDIIVRANAAPAGETGETQTTETTLADMPALQAAETAAPATAGNSQLTLLSF